MKTFGLAIVAVVIGLSAFSPAVGQQCVSDPAALAAGEMWFINNAPIVFKGKRYVKYGLPRILAPTEVVSVGKYRKTNISAEPGAKPNPEVVYVSVREGCEFQPYQLEEVPGCTAIDVSITSRAARQKERGVHIFTAIATPLVRSLKYKWTVRSLEADGSDLPAPEKFVLGVTSAKNLVISKAKLPKRTTARVGVEVTQAKGQCGVTEDSAVVITP